MVFEMKWLLRAWKWVTRTKSELPDDFVPLIEKGGRVYGMIDPVFDLNALELSAPKSEAETMKAYADNRIAEVKVLP